MKNILSYSTLSIALVVLTLSCAKKSDPEPSDPETTCKLIGFNSTIGSNPYSAVYYLNSLGQAVSLIQITAYGTTTSNFVYENSGYLTKYLDDSLNYQTFEYSGNTISKSTIFKNGTLFGYAVYNNQGDLYITKGYDSQNNLTSTNTYTINGSNFTGSSLISYNLNGQIIYTSSKTYANFDSKLSTKYTSTINIPGYSNYNGVSKNNPLNSTSTGTNYTNGIPTSSSTSISKFTYIYNSSGVVNQSIGTDISTGSNTVTNYTYSNCN